MIPAFDPAGIAAVALHLGAALWLGSRPRVRRAFATLPRAHVAVVAALLAAMLVGQLAQKSRSTFPFVDWRMYTSAPGEPRDTLPALHLEGVRDDGRPVRLSLRSLFGLHAGRVYGPLYRDAAPFAAGAVASDALARRRARVEERLAFLLLRHRALHPGERLAAVRLAVSSRPVRGASRPEAPGARATFAAGGGAAP